jgi:hypothetical protein
MPLIQSTKETGQSNLQLPFECCLACAAGELCKSQESSLAILWTVGIFALNCGPVLMGFVLDYLGPKFTAILGMWGPS